GDQHEQAIGTGPEPVQQRTQVQRFAIACIGQAVEQGTGADFAVHGRQVSGLPPLSVLNPLGVFGLRQAGDQQLVYAGAVEVNHLEAPATVVEMFAGVRDAAEVGDQHAGGGV